MFKKYGLSGIAVVLALALSGFTHAATDSRAPYSTMLVWFQVNAAGNAINAANGQAGTNPFGCAGSPALCAKALTYDSNPAASEVTLNGDGITYSIKSGVSLATDADATLRKTP